MGYFNSSGSDGTITNNIITNVGGSNLDYDVSVFYTDCDRALVANNTIEGKAMGANGTRTGIEIHGADQNCRDNKISNMVVGINIVGHENKPNTPSVDRQSYTNNTMTNVHNGFQIWTFNNLNDVLVQGNKITINVDKFFYSSLPTFAAGKYAAIYGIGIKEWRKPITRLKVADNEISFTDYSRVIQEKEFAASTYCAGIGFVTTGSALTELRNVSVLRNTINNSLSAGIQSFISVTKGLIYDNKIINPGQGSVYTGTARAFDATWDAYTAFHNSGIYITTKPRATVSDMTIANNNISTNKTLNYGVAADAVAIDGKCMIANNKVAGSATAIVQFKGTGWK
jgi:hypothetical protein